MGIGSYRRTLKREREIRALLHQIARQRVAVVLQPGNVLVVEHAPVRTDSMIQNLHTCHLRGWLEVVQQGVPTAEVDSDGRFPALFPQGARIEPVYRLTEAGWHEIKATHRWLLATFWVSVLALVAAAIGIYVDL